MRYRKLGRTGFEVSDIAYGLWGMSGWSGSDDRQSLDSLQLSVDSGCNFFDTAWAYGEGKSDALLGETMARNKKRLYAASKIPPANDKWPALPEYKYHDVFSQDHVLKYADQIRKKLRVDSIDVLQFHVWDDSWTENPEFRSTVEKLKDGGWIRSFGLSLNRWEPENGIKALHTGLVDVVQVIYNIFDQAPEDKLLPALPGTQHRRHRPRPARRRQPRRQDDARNPFPERRLALRLLRSGKSREHNRTCRQTKENRPRWHDPSRNVSALHPVAPRRQYHNCRHAQPRTRPSERRRQ